MQRRGSNTISWLNCRTSISSDRQTAELRDGTLVNVTSLAHLEPPPYLAGSVNACALTTSVMIRTRKIGYVSDSIIISFSGSEVVKPTISSRIPSTKRCVQLKRHQIGLTIP
jgi:hypothetical protein